MLGEQSAAATVPCHSLLIKFHWLFLGEVLVFFGQTLLDQAHRQQKMAICLHSRTAFSKRVLPVNFIFLSCALSLMNSLVIVKEAACLGLFLIETIFCVISLHFKRCWEDNI